MFRRWTGDAKLAVQLQGGLPVAKALGGEDRRLRIEMFGNRSAVVYLRVGSEDREPVWCAVQCTLHRPMPEDAFIKWAYLIARRIGTHTEWSVQFVLSRDRWPRDDAASEGSVGIDVGWRRVDDGLRVAYWTGSDGKEGELIIPHARLDAWKKIEHLQSIRDLHFNLMRDRLSDWLLAADDLPDWLLERAKSLRQWRSAARLAALSIEWREQRFAADALPLADAAEIASELRLEAAHYGEPEGMFDLLEAWRKKDKHLFDWQAHQRAKLQRWRDDLYRNFAADLRRRYKSARIKACNWAQLMRKPAPEDKANGALRKHMRTASVGRLLRLVADSMLVEKVATMATKQRCHACGNLCEELNPKILHTCRHCGEVWDQDRNEALNLLESGDVLRESNELPA
jgi:hypothetical protein